MTPIKNARHFIAALCIALILIGMACGFMLVDLSSDRYMPGMFAPLYLIYEAGPDGIAVYWMGQVYRLEIESVKQIQRTLWDFRGFIPRTVRLAGSMAAIVHTE